MSVLRVKRRRGVAPRIRTKRSTDADSASVMEGSPSVEKLQGMSLRDQDDRGTATSSQPTPEANFDMQPRPSPAPPSDRECRHRRQAGAASGRPARPAALDGPSG